MLKIVTLERFSYDLEMESRKENRNNKRTEIERFHWFSERIQTRVTARVNFIAINGYFTLTSYVTQLANRTMPFHIRVFFGGKTNNLVPRALDGEKSPGNEDAKTRSPCFDFSSSSGNKTNNRHLQKPFFTVIRKLNRSINVYYCTFSNDQTLYASVGGTRQKASTY